MLLSALRFWMAVLDGHGLFPEGCSSETVFVEQIYVWKSSSHQQILVGFLGRRPKFHCSVEKGFGRSVTRLWCIQ